MNVGKNGDRNGEAESAGGRCSETEGRLLSARERKEGKCGHYWRKKRDDDAAG
jgi:hypothetical protein